jgi:DNA-binding GntR family transcriptional regulator
MADQIAAVIRSSIASGTLRPRTHLLEVQIAREMETSRIPVREALMQLEREGLVVRQPNRGTFVADVTEEMVREVASLRGLLEGFAGTLAVKRLTSEDFQRLEMMAKEMLAAARLGNFSRVVECDFQFHSYIVHAAGHDLLEDMWRSMDGKIRVYLSATNLMYAELKSIVRGHVAILEALRRRDPRKAGKVMSEHIEEVLNLFVTRVLNKRISAFGGTVRK